MSRESILNRVREAARAGRAYRVHLRDDLPANVGYLGGGDDLVARMAREVNEVGGLAHVVDDEAAAGETLQQLLRQYSARSALCWQHPLLERIGLSQVLDTAGVKRYDCDALSGMNEAARRATIVAADIGITSATWAIAETGTLAMAAEPGRERAASLLPPVHVAIIERSQMLPDLLDLFELVGREDRGTRDEEEHRGSRGEGRGDAQAKLPSSPDPRSFVLPLPSNLTLITGPSKTGDIELQLTTGVHGPGKWHVVILRKGRGGRGGQGLEDRG